MKRHSSDIQTYIICAMWYQQRAEAHRVIRTEDLSGASTGLCTNCSSSRGADRRGGAHFPVVLHWLLTFPRNTCLQLLPPLNLSCESLTQVRRVSAQEAAPLLYWIIRGVSFRFRDTHCREQGHEVLDPVACFIDHMWKRLLLMSRDISSLPTELASSQPREDHRYAGAHDC